MQQIPFNKSCTACGACVASCPQNCVVFIEDALKNTVAVKGANCLDCHLCEKVCPQNYQRDDLNIPKKCFAAWSLDNEIRGRSASGGVATELYLLAAEKDMWFSGVSMSSEFKAVHQLTCDPHRITDFQNSKYVYSDMGDIFLEIVEKLKSGESVLFIGVPCQVDAIRHFCDLKRVPLDNLYLADLICHGVAPAVLLHEHIEYIEKKKKCNATEVFFRDPDNKTHTYTFSLRNNGRAFYSKKVDQNDTYQIGYHKGIIYRENCYSCKYAQMKRAGDLTLADFSYVGKKAACSYGNVNVSCVLVNSEKGNRMLKALKNSGRVFCEERPMEEEIQFEHMLSAPTAIPTERQVFLKAYSQGLGFEKSMRMAAKRIILKNQIFYFFHVKGLKRWMAQNLPQELKDFLKRQNEKINNQNG